MTEIPECPLCGKKIAVVTTILGYAVGCTECGIMMPTFTGPGLIIPNGVDREEYQRKFEEHLYSIWENANRKTTSLNALRMENVLRTAYGMPQVSYMESIDRNWLRRMKNDYEI